MDELLGRQSAFNEAKALFRMIGAEHTVEELRELIAVPPKIEAVLLAYAETFPEEAYFVERVLKFRVAVLEEFDHLVRDGLQVNSPEEEGTELDAIEETYAVAHA